MLEKKEQSILQIIIIISIDLKNIILEATFLYIKAILYSVNIKPIIIKLIQPFLIL